MSRSPWFVAGLIAGSGVGAALALLFAPSSGRETLNAVKAHFRNARDEARTAGMRAEQDILTRYQQVKTASMTTHPGPVSLAPAVR
jgi:gas vesicle protein